MARSRLGVWLVGALGNDTMPAAPLVLDLVRLADLAQRRGEAGPMPHAASFFKAPYGVAEIGFAAQMEMLRADARLAAERPAPKAAAAPARETQVTKRTRRARPVKAR